MGALAATLLPALTGLALLALAPALERRLGLAGASAAAARATLAAAVLAILLLLQVVQRGQIEHRFAWVRIGRTTALDWLIQLDPLALLLAAVALVGMVLGVVAGLAAGPTGGARPAARIALAGGGALVLACAGTLWQAGLGLGLIVLALRACPNEHVLDKNELPDRTWLLGLVGVGLGAAGVAWIGGAGDLELATLERTALGQAGSELARGGLGGPMGEIAPGVIAGVGVGVAALAWVLAWPRVLARAWVDGPAAAALAALVGLPAVAVIGLRMHLALALAPTVLAMVTAGAAVVAVVAGVQAARARRTAGFVVAGGQVTLAIAVATAAIGDPIAAARLLVAGALASAAMITAVASATRGRTVVAGLAAIGLVPAIGAAIAALWLDLSAWSSGLNVVAPALALVAVAGLAAGYRRVLLDRTEAPAWPRPEAGSLLLVVGLMLALVAATAGLWPLEEQLWPLFITGRMLEGAYALGPRPGAMVFGTGAGALATGLAAAVGLAVAGQVQPAAIAEAEWRWIGGATGARLLRLGERLLAQLTLRPGDERVVVAPGRVDVRGPLLLAAAGTLAILGSVFCNPDVLVLGPSRVHPVDLGGLDPAMAGARRAAPVAPANSVRSAGQVPGSEIDAPVLPGGDLPGPPEQRHESKDMSKREGMSRPGAGGAP